ncbi:MAG: YrdB family protein [Anaerolineaceae bacterium]
MNSHPVVLTLAFFLELAGLVCMGVWGWQAGAGWMRYALAAGIPLLAAALWGTFRVPGDIGKGLVAVPGWLRLALELAFYAFAVWALFRSGYAAVGWVMAALVVIRYAASFDRVLWLLKQ